MENLYKEILNYDAFWGSGVKDRECMLEALRLGKDLLSRYMLMHFTASAFVVNPSRTKMLVVYHKIYDGLIYPGGHADGESDLLSVAVREVMEETNVKPKVLQESIFAISVLSARSHVKGKEYVPSHIDLDLIYLMEASEEEVLKFRLDESSDVRWLPFSEADGREVVDYMRPVNARLIKKLQALGK